MENAEFSSPDLSKPEFRLYYDDSGAVVCYTCEKLPGSYITVDAMTYAECRHDVKVVNGRFKRYATASVNRLARADSGVAASAEDLSILVPADYAGRIQHWKLEQHDLEDY